MDKRGFLERDAENSYLTLEPADEDAMVQLQGHLITYRIAVRPAAEPESTLVAAIAVIPDCL
jgi:hypothetical protein